MQMQMLRIFLSLILQVLFALNHTLWMQEDLRRGNNPHPTPSATDLIGHYNCGNLDEVLFSLDSGQVPDLLSMALAPNEVSAAQEIDSYFREELIHKRNERMAERIDALMSEHPHKSFFFAFGAGQSRCNFSSNLHEALYLQSREDGITGFGLDILQTMLHKQIASKTKASGGIWSPPCGFPLTLTQQACSTPNNAKNNV